MTTRSIWTIGAAFVLCLSLAACDRKAPVSGTQDASSHVGRRGNRRIGRVAGDPAPFPGHPDGISPSTRRRTSPRTRNSPVRVTRKASNPRGDLTSPGIGPTHTPARCPGPPTNANDDDRRTLNGRRDDFPLRIDSLYISREGSRGYRVHVLGRVQNLSRTVLIGAQVAVSLALEFDGYCLGQKGRLTLGPSWHPVIPSIEALPRGEYRGRPWRHREWRGFHLATPALKTMLKFLRVKRARVAVDLKTSDWLCYRFRDRLAEIPIRWDAILGARVKGRAKTTRAAILLGARRYKIKKDEEVKLSFQRGRYFHVTMSGGESGWIDGRHLQIVQPGKLYDVKPRVNDRLTASVPGQFSLQLRNIETVKYFPGVRLGGEQRLLVADVRLTNRSSEEWRCRVENLFHVDYGIRQSRPLRGPDSSALRCDHMAAGETRKGKLFFRVSATRIPFFVGLRSPAGKALVEIDVFDAKWRNVLLRDGLEVLEAGPQRFNLKVQQAFLIDDYPNRNSTGFAITGRIQNLTRRTLTDVRLRPELRLFKRDDSKRCDQFSSYREDKLPQFRITPSIDSQSPWKPGEWRNFSAESLRLNKLFRDVSFKRVVGELRIEAEGAFCYGLAPKVFETEYAWRALFGTRVHGEGRIVRSGVIYSEHGKRPHRTSAGDRFRARYQKGHWFHIQLAGGMAGWIHARYLQFDDLNSLYHPTKPPKRPMELQTSDGLSVRLVSIKEADTYEGVELRADEGLYVVTVELTNNSTSRITRCDLKRQTYLDYGGKSRQGPTLISDGFRCDGLDVGQRRRGDLVFRRGRYDLPFGLYLQSPAKKSVFIHLYDDKFDVLVDKLNAPLLDDREKNDKRDIN